MCCDMCNPTDARGCVQRWLLANGAFWILCSPTRVSTAVPKPHTPKPSTKLNAKL